MNYILCLNVGKGFSHGYTVALYHALKKHIERPFRFICYTDKPHAVPNYIETRGVPVSGFEGWWNKLLLFDDPQIPDNATATFFDLDVIPGPGVEDMLDLPKVANGTPHAFRILNDFAHLGTPGKFNSSAMTWRYGNFRKITRQWLHLGSPKPPGGDQAFLEEYFRREKIPHEYFDRTRCVSAKWHKGPLENRWQLVAFHGRPRPHEAAKESVAAEPHAVLARKHLQPFLRYYRNAYAGKRAELLLTGPSLRFYKQDPGAVSFGVNSILCEAGWKVDHYLIQDRGAHNNPRSFHGTPHTYKAFEPGVAKWVGNFGFDPFSAATMGAGLVPTQTGKIIGKNFRFEDPHTALPFRSSVPFSTRNSVAFTALQMLVYMGFREVSVVGADITGGRIGQPETVDHLSPIAALLRDTWKKAVEWAEENGTEILMVNPVGLKGLGFKEIEALHEPTKQTVGIGSPEATSPKHALHISHEEHKTTPGENLRFHILPPPYAGTSEKYCLCAYAQKALKWARMMDPFGFEIHHYGHPEHQLPSDVRHHTVIESSDWRALGLHERGNWREKFFDAKNPKLQTLFNHRAHAELKKHVRPKDFILHFWSGDRGASEGLGDVLRVEPGIGYTGVFAPFRVFESYAIRNHVFGIEAGRRGPTHDPSRFDCVIPNYFDPKDFDFRPTKGGCFLYLGRVVKRKGMEIILTLAREHPEETFIIAGQGRLEDVFGGKVPIPPNIEQRPFADLETRKNLLASAKAVLCPTLYNEPFGGVAVEAMLSGTPVITSDVGAFPETVAHGFSGYICRSYADYLEALKRAPALDRHQVREHAEAYLFEHVAPQYLTYFEWLHHVAHDPKRKWWTLAGGVVPNPS